MIYNFIESHIVLKISDHLLILDNYLHADINECTLDLDICGPNKTCIDTIGNFSCICSPGYTGNGEQCISKFLLLYRLYIVGKN